jgi:hypothetical protein
MGVACMVRARVHPSDREALAPQLQCDGGGLRLFSVAPHPTINSVAITPAIIRRIGILGILSFISHTVFADSTAASIGWRAGNPFQSEVAVANLAVGILGILCYWMRGNFWVATAIGFSVWFLGDAVVHIRSIVVDENYAPANAGVTFYMDILLPVILIALLVYYLYAKRHEQGVTPTERTAG